MTHLQAIRAQLVAASSVTDLVGSRIYPQKAPQGAADPLVVLTTISAVPEATFTGAPSALLEAATVQVDCYAKTYLGAHEVATAIDDVLGALSGPTISAVRAGQRDLYDDRTESHRVSSDYTVLR